MKQAARALVLIVLAGVCLKALIFLLSPQIPKDTPADVQALIKQLKSRDPQARADAAFELGWMGRRAKNAVPFLVRMLDDAWEARDPRPGYPVGQAAAQALARIGKPAVPALIEQLRSRSDLRRYLAILALQAIGDPQAVPPLIELIRNPKAARRSNAADALGQLRDPRAVEPLIEALGDRDKLVGLAACIALGSLGDKRAVRPMADALERDTSEQVRIAAASSLARLGGPEAVEALCRALRDRKPIIRDHTLRALLKLKDPSSVRPCIDALQDSNSGTVPLLATVLGELGDPRAAQPLGQLLKSGEKWRRQAVVSALSKLGPAGVEVMVGLLNSDSADDRELAAEYMPCKDELGLTAVISLLRDPEGKVKLAACRNLAKAKEAQAVEPLISLFDDRDPEIRAMAANALLEIGDRRALEPLLKLYDEDVNEKVKAASMMAYAVFGLPDAEEKLGGALQTGSDAVRAAAARGLIMKPSPLIVVTLVESLNDPARSVQIAIVKALQQARDPDATEGLLELFAKVGMRAGNRYSDDGLRLAVLEALAEVGDARVAEPLAACIKKDGCKALGEIGYPYLLLALGRSRTPLAFDTLLPLLRFREPVARDRVAEALGETGDTRAVEPLIVALPDLQWGPTDGVMKALGKLKDPRAIEPLITALRGARDDNRSAAFEALRSITGQDFGPDFLKWEEWWERNRPQSR